MAEQQRISYVPLEAMDDAMRAEMERCAREGTPRPESSAVRAHVPAAFWFFANSWRDLFHTGVCDHAIKELCRVYVSRTVKCEYCGNQRSEQGRSKGLQEAQYDDLLNFETSERFDERQRAALAYAEAIAWRLETDDGRYLLFASAAGVDRSPAWYWNLVANPDASIEVGDERLDVHAVELSGAERDEKYAEQADRYPQYAEYQRSTTRTIPVVALTAKSAAT